MTSAVRKAFVGIALVAVLVFARPAQATEVSVELRHTLVQTAMTADTFAALGGTLALSVSEKIWVGAGYELVQNHKATIWASETHGYKPIVLSAVHVGAWYRGGQNRHGITYAMGPVVSFANSALPPAKSPSDTFARLDSQTYFTDSGADLSFGYVGGRGRIEIFMTPAWSYGRVVSPAIGREEHLNTFVVRMGVAFSLVFGS